MEGLVNTITTVGSDSEVEYAPVPAGKNIMGLVGVKNCKAKDFKDKAKEHDAYRFTFRHKDIHSGFVNVTVAAKTGMKKCALVRLMKNMTDGAVPDTISPQDAFDTICALVGGWYSVRVVHNVAKDGSGKVYYNLDDYQAVPATGPDIDKLPDAVAYFNAIDSAAAGDVAADENGEALVTDTPPLTSFYKLAGLPDASLKKAIELLENAGGQRVNVGDIYWGSPRELKPLAKLRCPREEAEDNIPL